MTFKTNSSSKFSF
uniref:ORF 1 protein n=1 Tax=Homo sapiens TaxID=9606 RepID=Q29823_HUMAN|nr:ORF 1 [Homo sapiens]